MAHTNEAGTAIDPTAQTAEQTTAPRAGPVRTGGSDSGKDI
ncbi:MAG TPA: hypothetical protein VGV37_12805 [Aliidongia sp.]|nr:hypothetical protein [Aliidongia sp.]HEV2675415.1 hypothetical protein [Aliidongia sp.]